MHAAPPTELSEPTSERYAKRVNPEWVRLLDLLQLIVRYERCVGAELVTDDGRRILDVLSVTAFTTLAMAIPRLFVLCRMNWSDAVRQ